MNTIEVYCHIPAETSETVVECGLKLSEMADREIDIEGINKRCFPAYLSPEDDVRFYGRTDYRCLKLQVRKSVCRMADDFLFDLSKRNNIASEYYFKSIIPIEKYVFGMYRKPVCLVSTTMIPGEITLLNKYLDSPVLFRDSEELYVNSILEEFRNYKEDFIDELLYRYFLWLEKKDEAFRIESEEAGKTAFVIKSKNRVYCIRSINLER